MKILIDIRNEAKVPFIMEFLDSQSYIKIKPLANTKKSKLAKDLQEAMSEVKQLRKGKTKMKTAKQLLREL